MKAGKGKILIRFTKDQIERFDREESKYLKRKNFSELIKVNDSGSFTYEIDASIEVGEVAAVNSKQTMLKVGDRVFLSYLVFISGRYDKDNRRPNNLLMTELNGDEIYFANDGTGGDQSEIYARVLPGGEIEMLPDFLLINEPRRIKKIGLIYMPANFKEDRDETPYWATVLNVAPSQQKEDFKEGDSILCRAGFYFEVKTQGDPIYVIRRANILAKQAV